MIKGTLLHLGDFVGRSRNGAAFGTTHSTHVYALWGVWPPQLCTAACRPMAGLEWWHLGHQGSYQHCLYRCVCALKLSKFQPPQTLLKQIGPVCNVTLLKTHPESDSASIKVHKNFTKSAQIYKIDF